MERSQLVELLKKRLDLLPLNDKARLIFDYCIEKGKEPEHTNKFINTVMAMDGHPFLLESNIDRLVNHIIREESVNHEIVYLIDLNTNNIIGIF